MSVGIRIPNAVILYYYDILLLIIRVTVLGFLPIVAK